MGDFNSVKKAAKDSDKIIDVMHAADYRPPHVAIGSVPSDCVISFSNKPSCEEVREELNSHGANYEYVWTVYENDDHRINGDWLAGLMLSERKARNVEEVPCGNDSDMRLLYE